MHNEEGPPPEPCEAPTEEPSAEEPPESEKAILASPPQEPCDAPTEEPNVEESPGPILSSPTALRIYVPNHLKMTGIFANRSHHTSMRHQNPMMHPPRSTMLRNHRPNQLPMMTNFQNLIQPNNLTLFPFHQNHHQSK